jgi:ATP-dependent DNA helicase RecG
MRPDLLFPLFANITSLPGVGDKLGRLFEKLAGPHVVDLLWHLPSGLVDRRQIATVSSAPEGRIATLRLVVDQHLPGSGPKRPYKVRCRDATGFLHLVFFHGREDWLRKQLPDGQERIVSGMIDRFQDEVQITHPDRIEPPERLEEVATVDPIHPLTTGLTARMVAKAVKAALTKAPELPEWLDSELKRRQGWPDWREALQAVHAPADEDDLDPNTPARRRLAYDELLANQLALALVRLHLRQLSGRAIEGDGRLREKVLAALPFSLTGAQLRALAEIDSDLKQPARMLRLLQGDVGSGKTVVALLAMLAAVESGAQAVLMAPTEILARQHLATIQPLAEAAGVRVALLTGREKGKTRQALLDDLAVGDIAIALGTHALFQEDVAFHDLALAVVDEQHRFGVHQRLELAAKGRAVDMLVMTATPIPRTLTLTAYGDMDVSRLDEKPPGRKPVTTVAIPLSRLDEVVSGVDRALAGGAKVYWVCPLVEESEKIDLAAAEERHAHLAELFGPRAGLVHGRMKGTQKDAVMSAFAEGDVDVLVATTVIEVGVNVPQATVMVIEHAERFGLAQLHQLRGRIGRGDKASTCLLLYGQPLHETAKARLNIMRDTEDGFRIAEEDLRLRGAGELLGTRQSGLPQFRVGDLAAHGDLLPIARDDAKLILARDPELSSERGQALRVLLYLWERDAQVKTLRSG